MQDLRPYVCAVTDKNSTVRGTAFFFRPDGYLLTCDHVVASCDGAPLIKAFGQRELISCDVIDSHDRLDAAILKVSGNTWSALDLDVAQIWDFADKVASHGFSKDYGIRIFTDGYPLVETSIGSLTSVMDKKRGKAEAIPLEGSTVNQGLSGAPAYNVRRRNVIGILRWQQEQSSSLATPIPTLVREWDMLRKLVQTRVARGWGNIPYQLNREVETPTLVQAASSIVRKENRRPIFCVVHARDNECPDAFLEIFKNQLLPNIIREKGMFRWLPKSVILEDDSSATANWVRLDWPYRIGSAPPDKMYDLLTQIEENLKLSAPGVPAYDTDDDVVYADQRVTGIQAMIERETGPVLIRCDLDSARLSKVDIETLVELHRFWNAFPDLKQGRLVAVCSVIYQRDCSWRKLGQIWRSRRARRLVSTMATQRSDTGLVVVPQFRPVEQSDAEFWAQYLYDKGVWQVHIDQILTEIAEIYSGTRSKGKRASMTILPMRELGSQLTELLHRHGKNG